MRKKELHLMSSKESWAAYEPEDAAILIQEIGTEEFSEREKLELLRKKYTLRFHV